MEDGGPINFAEQPHILPSHGANIIENLMNSLAEPWTLATKEAFEATEHYFIAAHLADDITVDKIATIDTNIENPESITTFLTLPMVAPRATSRRPNFTKSVMLTSEQYMNVVLEARRARFTMATEKE